MLALTALVVIAGTAIPIIKPYFIEHTYAMGNAEVLLPKKDPLLARKLVENYKEGKFNFNEKYVPIGDAGKGGGPKISAASFIDPKKGLSVSDPYNNVDFTLTPKFKLLDGRKDGNRVVYPLLNGTGWLVYTMQAGSVKEDVVLKSAHGDSMVLEYELGLGDSLEARLEKGGDVGVYGSSLPVTGNVTTGSDKDAELLKRARQKAKKDKLLFTIPAPIAYEAEGVEAPVSVRYELEGKTLKTVVTGLKKGRYPLTIDPSVTVNSTSDLFRDTNPDSNVDFDATSGNISRGAVTGGVLGDADGGSAWTTNGTSFGTARFMHAATIYDDYAYVAGGAAANTTTNQTSVQFAHLSSADDSIGTWAATTALPTALSRFELVAYNGYLYAIGGSITNTTCGTVADTVYYNRMQVNGDLTATWTATSTLPAGLCGIGAAAYDGKIYAIGGRTGSTAATGVTTVAYATVKPDGTLSSWTSDDSVLPAARYDHDIQVYNGYIYVLGGNLNGTITNTVLYAPLASDGSIYATGSGSWKSTSGISTVGGVSGLRTNMGSSFTAANDGYMYMHSGCRTLNGTFSCTEIRNETQIAQINADGSLGPWSDIDASVSTLGRVGHSIVLWRGTVYSFGGCTSMNTGTISCATGAPTLASVSYAPIKTAGQVGPVNTTTALPQGIYAHGTVVNNGFIYVIGGCITNTDNDSCQTGASDTTGSVRYATLNTDGTIGSWTLDGNTLNGATGLAAFATTVINNYLYISGGYTYAGPTASQFRTTLSSTGGLSAWTTMTGTTGLSSARYYSSSIARGGFLYVFGGCTGNTNQAGCTTYSNIVHRFNINLSSGGLSSRTNLTNLPAGKGLMAPALYNGYIYLAGGATSGSAQTNNVYYARINDDGSMGSWSTATGTLTNQLRRADAVAMNGYLYVFGGHNGATGTTYGNINIGKIDLATGNIPNNFEDSVIQITPRWDTRAVFANGYVYATGGCSTGSPAADCTGISTLTEYVEVFNAGNKGASAWTGQTAYSTNRTVPATVAYNGYLYVAGGCSSFTVGTSFGNTFCSTGLDTTTYAALNPDGTIGTWQTGPEITGAGGTQTRVAGCLVANAGYLYYIGGEDNTGTATDDVYYSQIGGAGAPGTWTLSGTSLAGASTRAWHGCAVFADRIYVTGGLNAASSFNATAFYSTAIPSGGDITSWTSGTTFAGARGQHVTVVVGGYLFVIGGDNGGTNPEITALSIQLNPTTGAPTGSWQESRDLPQWMSYQSGFAANGYIYLFGGRTAATTCVANTFVTSVNSTGRTGGWSVTPNKFTTARFGAGAAFYNGYYYLMGGNDCTNTISTNVVQYGGMQSQAMKGLLSKYADLNGNGKPRAFVAYLTNAVNGGVDIEKWRMRYRSSFESTNDWGQTTTVNPITSEQTYAVSSLDSGGTDIQLSRWFWFSLEMNMEQSFTFHDDTRPTVFQYELHYSPPPGKRLMHGRDFRDQTQQGLDASPL
jgi:hypothetical protein